MRPKHHVIITVNKTQFGMASTSLCIALNFLLRHVSQNVP